MTDGTAHGNSRSHGTWRPHVPQRVLEEERHEDEDDVRASIQTAKADELASLKEESKTIDALQCQVFRGLPSELRESLVWNPDESNPEDYQTGHPEHMMQLKMIREQLGTIAVHQEAIAGEMMSSKEKLDSLRMEWKITYRKRDENFILLENINFKIMKLGDSLETLRMSRVKLMKTVRKSPQ
ncbi:hypothetical protein E1301_Tti023815 [Triplophysa tibetana]|uniref:Uncharacterized protein n=1 Tax=Triplophysa tibetana TaxID=1572043 RepID=A0A5A9P2D5_9TELE|nr:hypothetical protein E1301_Tti015848 [Triplophysa tibetana]KAA0716201.1 hypothetical protein E1301_Tti023815 [Triplophysa tibetana]